MGVPTDIAPGKDGADDPESWDQTFNSPDPESKTPGYGESLQNNPGGLEKERLAVIDFPLWKQIAMKGFTLIARQLNRPFV